MSKVRYTPANPGPVAKSFAAYVNREHDVNITPEIAQAFFSYHNEWQTFRNSFVGEDGMTEAGREAAVRKAAKAEADAEKLAKQIAKAEALLASVASAKVAEVETPKAPTQSTRTRKAS